MPLAWAKPEIGAADGRRYRHERIMVVGARHGKAMPGAGHFCWSWPSAAGTYRFGLSAPDRYVTA